MNEPRELTKEEQGLLDNLADQVGAKNIFDWFIYRSRHSLAFNDIMYWATYESPDYSE